MLDKNLNCRVRAPLFLFYDFVYLKNPDPRSMKMTMDMLTTIASGSKCTKVHLLRIDSLFAMPSNVNVSIMEDDIIHGIPAGVGYRCVCVCVCVCVCGLPVSWPAFLLQSGIFTMFDLNLLFFVARSMCRFWSGLVFLVPELRDFDYYMRLDDGSKIMSPIQYDPFKYMVCFARRPILYQHKLWNSQ